MVVETRPTLIRVIIMPSLRDFDWKKVILGAKRPIIFALAAYISYLGGLEQWSWITGLSAERIWATLEFYLRNKR